MTLPTLGTKCSATFRLTVGRGTHPSLKTHFFIVMQNLLHRALSVMLLQVIAIFCIAIGTRLGCRVLLKACDDCSQPLDPFF